FMLTSSSLIFLPLLYTIIAFLIFFLLLFIIFFKQKLKSLVQAGIRDIEEQNQLDKQLLISEIADRKQSELMTEQAKQQLINITNTIPGVVFQLQTFEQDIIIKFMSDGIKLLHYIDAKQLGSNFNCFIQSILEADQLTVINAINHAVRELDSISCEYQVINDEGNISWVHMQATVSPISDSGNDVVLFDDDEVQQEVNINGHLQDITQSKQAHQLLLEQQQEIKLIHKQTRESIEYAALIQGALIPDNNITEKYFQDFFAIWHPKDVVGGDIYFAEELRHDDEFLLMVIDCTGHGVPGGFVSMLVKAVERQIITQILNSNDSVSPANILTTFNQNIKQLLQQEDTESISNAGFDGGILYYNKKENLLRFAGAYTPLFVIQENQLTIIKGNRHSVGYDVSDADYIFTDHEIVLDKETIIYLTTDGFLDQNGGKKGFPFGNKRFKKLLLEINHETMADQKELFLYALQKYQKQNERNDDITIIGVKI
ncbi:MAG: SpoIIE family protein phosphatase, partial [gamma proteobacterium symbiont of Taylorina sp.]|nr:SpoIIE family protein phosphatase [gamma proteobacterium symbiont of Taylorina sp.]